MCRLLVCMSLLSHSMSDAFVLHSPFRAASQNRGYAHVADASHLWRPNDTTFDLWSSVLTWPYPRDGLQGLGGLYGGLTWALHPSLCASIQPAFRDTQYAFVSTLRCNQLRDTVAESFETWSENHPLLQFRDRTDACARSGPLSPEQHCPGTQITIRMQTASDAMHADVAAFVRHRWRDLAYTTRLTNGKTVAGLAVNQTEIVLSARMCWYIDSTFCVLFHRHPKLMGFDTLLIVRSVLLAFALLTAAVFCHGLANFVARLCNQPSWYRCLSRKCRRGECTSLFSRSGAPLAASRTPTTPRERLRRELAQLSPCSLLCVAFTVIFLPVFHFSVFVPCADCYGFHGVISHEIGHVLGFHHPDEHSNLNLRRGEARANYLLSIHARSHIRSSHL